MLDDNDKEIRGFNANNCKALNAVTTCLTERRSQSGSPEPAVV